jgi:hypothetical protein
MSSGSFWITLQFICVLVALGVGAVLAKAEDHRDRMKRHGGKQ